MIKPVQNAVIVLGMHRCGTSALCGALHLTGVDFGTNLLPATEANEKGHWEHKEMVELHHELLSAFGSSWDDDETLPPDWMQREISGEIRSRLIDILKRDFGAKPLFGLKDPRMCRLMPLWFPIFRTLGVEPHFALMVRHPSEVAESLAKRDGMEHSKSYLLWIDHVVQAEGATRGHTRSFVRYEDILDDPVAVLDKLKRELGVRLDPPSGRRESLREFLDPSLRHHQVNREFDKLTSPVPQLALDFYEVIRNSSTPREITSKLELLATEFSRLRAALQRQCVRIEKLSPEKILRISLEISEPPREVSVSAPFWVDAKITNETNDALSFVAPSSVRLAYHWIEKMTRQMVIFDGERSALSPSLGPKTTERYPMKIVAPSQPGEYILQATLVQEGVCWFENIHPSIMQEFCVSVTT